MPLTAKGNTILTALVERYGEEKGKSIFYAGINKGTFKGVEKNPPAPKKD